MIRHQKKVGAFVRTVPIPPKNVAKLPDYYLSCKYFDPKKWVAITHLFLQCKQQSQTKSISSAKPPNLPFLIQLSLKRPSPSKPPSSKYSFLSNSPSPTMPSLNLCPQKTLYKSFHLHQHFHLHRTRFKYRERSPI